MSEKKAVRAIVSEQQRNVQVVKNYAKVTAAIEAAKKASSGKK